METVTPMIELQSLIHLECQRSVKYVFRILSLCRIVIVNMKVVARTKLLTNFKFVLKRCYKFDFAIVTSQLKGLVIQRLK